MNDTESWDGRLKIGNTCEALMAKYFDQRGWSYRRTGVEHDAAAHSNTPDYLLNHPNGTVWVECKSRISISRDSYEHCLAVNADHPVFLAVQQPVTGVDDDGNTHYTILIWRVTDLVFTTADWRTDFTSPT